MTHDESLLDRFGFPFLPADPSRGGLVVEAGPDWAMDLPDEADGLDRVVWGRTPDTQSSPSRALRSAVARERALRRLGRSRSDRFRVVAVHRLPAARLGGARRTAVRSAIRAGAIVELAVDPGTDRILDACLAAAGVRPSSQPLAFGSGGTLLVRVAGDMGPGLLRVARSGSPGDPAGLHLTLGWLAASGVAMAPRPLGGGTAGAASWTLESLLAGRRPARLDADLAGDVARTLAAFPRGDGPPTALAEDLAGVAERLPRQRNRIASLATRVAADVATLPAILRHGDLWTGNLLVEGGRLTGFVDWDAAHRAGIPGSDLVQVVAVDLRARRGQSLGAAYLARPWDSTEFRTAAAEYWPAAGIEPTPRAIELAGLGWWAAEVHGTLRRAPARATDERWLAANVQPVLAALDV